MDLIFSKITIPPEIPRITRNRLLGLLQESLYRCSSTVIIGRTGTGKTMLAADFARRCGWRTAWYKVDAPDMDMHTFVKYLTACVATEFPGFGKQTVAQLYELNETEPTLIAESYAYELQRYEDPLLLIIDDLHLTYDAEWIVPFFHRLLPLLPTQVHLLIIGRSLLPAPLWRLRSKQRLDVIDEAALAFTQDEAEELFAYYEMNTEIANIALTTTRGRAGALHAEAYRLKMLDKGTWAQHRQPSASFPIS